MKRNCWKYEICERYICPYERLSEIRFNFWDLINIWQTKVYLICICKLLASGNIYEIHPNHFIKTVAEMDIPETMSKSLHSRRFIPAFDAYDIPIISSIPNWLLYHAPHQLVPNASHVDTIRFVIFYYTLAVLWGHKTPRNMQIIFTEGVSFIIIQC